jgi:hypothetical protein
VPPIHLHFDQEETFEVISGSWGLTAGYDRKDIILTKGETFTIKTWVPHFPWPVADETEETVLLMYAQPSSTPNPTDHLFFSNLFRYVSDIFEKKASMDIFQFVVMQYVNHEECNS